jgi:hypothetical protein
VGWKSLGKTEHGVLLFQDIGLTISRSFSVNGRLIFFHTDSYESRLYEYENDLRGAFSNPGLYGVGKRVYVMVRYTVTPEVMLSAKYAETQKEGVTSIGSGPTEIQGNLDNRISFQMDVSL